MISIFDRVGALLTGALSTGGENAYYKLVTNIFFFPFYVLKSFCGICLYFENHVSYFVQNRRK